MEVFFGVVIGLVILVTLVVLHELGHGIMARRNGVVVEEFGIGFPPLAWSRKLKNRATKLIAKDEIIFSLNWLPLGGFVRLKGEYDSANKKGDYGAATFWQKTKILLAGVVINWLTAAVLFSILAVTGLPKIIPDQYSVPGDTRVTTDPVAIGVVGKDSPAAKAGLQKGDVILKFAGQNVTSSDIVSTKAKENKGRSVAIVYSRGGTERTVTATMRNEAAGGYLGVSFKSQFSMIHATWSAPIVGVATTAQLTGLTLEGLGKLVTGLGSGIASQFSGDEAVKKAGNQELETAGQSVSGPVGIFGVLFPAASAAGPTALILLTAIISLSLAVMNVLPIPALDGGRWFVMAIFRLLKKPLTKAREEKIQAAGFLTLMALIVLVTIVDVGKIIG